MDAEASPVPRRPILGVDVDGVLNLLEVESDARAVMAELWTRADGLVMPIPLGTTERLARLTAAFDMVWATSWGPRAYPELKDIFAIDREWPVIDLWWDHMPNIVDTWKLPAIQRWLDGQAASGDWHPWSGPAFAWLDDDMQDDAMTWADERSRSAPTLFIRVDPTTGLTDEHVERLLAWARDLGGT